MSKDFSAYFDTHLCTSIVASMAHRVDLSGGRVDFGRVREEAKEAILGLVGASGGKTALIVDKEVGGILSHIVGASALKDHGVAEIQYLGDGSPSREVEAVVGIVRATLSHAPLLAEMVREAPKGARKIAAFVPGRAMVMEQALEAEGVLNSLELTDLSLDLVPKETDVLSMELPRYFRESALEGDPGPHRAAARALDRLQRLTGTIPLVRGKGLGARSVASMMTSLRREQEAEGRRKGAPSADMLLLIDREVDLVTPMSTQLTYEGLIDEVFGIRDGSAEVPQGDEGGKKAKAKLNSSDELFSCLRDLSFGKACDVLRERSSALQKSYREIKGSPMDHQDVGEIRDFVQAVKANVGAGVDLHASIAHALLSRSRGRKFMRRLDIERHCVEGTGADEVCDLLEEMAGRQEPLVDVLRVATLLSLTHGGIPRRSHEAFRRELMLAYGCENALTLGNLDKLGLLARLDPGSILHGPKNAFASASKPLHLVAQAGTESDICFAFPHSGYAPLSIRLTERAIRGGWWEEEVKNVPGLQFEFSQTTDSNGKPAEGPFDGQRLSSRADGRRPVVLVAFLGGATFAELSCLRFLSREDKVPCDFVALPTSMVNGSCLLHQCLEEPVLNALAQNNLSAE